MGKELSLTQFGTKLSPDRMPGLVPLRTNKNLYVGKPMGEAVEVISSSRPR
jgi:hypothetical protein